MQIMRIQGVVSADSSHIDNSETHTHSDTQIQTQGYRVTLSWIGRRALKSFAMDEMHLHYKLELGVIL